MDAGIQWEFIQFDFEIITHSANTKNTAPYRIKGEYMNA